MKGRIVCLLLVGVIAAGAICWALPVMVEQVLTSEPGFGEYRWGDEDFGWTHTLEAGVLASWLLGEATLTVRAYDVDWSAEKDMVYADGNLLGPLRGSSGATTNTEFTVPDLAAMFGDGLLDIWLDIDSTNGNWAVTIHNSILRYRYLPPSTRADIVAVEVPVGAGGATGAPGGEVQITVLNTGGVSYVGPCAVFAGLAYTTSWLPEGVTIFDTYDAGIVELVPGVPLILTFPLAEIPAALLDLFRARLLDVWTGFEDDDPQDYVGFFIRFDGLPTVVDYLPLP